MNEDARPVETLDHVRSILDSGVAYFPELLDCVAVARAANDWDLVERAGTALLRCSTGRPKRALPSLADAARAIVTAYLARAADLDEAAERAAAAAGVLAAISDDTDVTGPAAKAVRDRYRWLEELRLLYSDFTEPSLIALCSKLREIDRPDLGVEAATKALELAERFAPAPSTRAAALTTRAAAHLDLGDPPRALADIRKATKAKPRDPYVLTTHARVLTACGHPHEAVEVAKDSFALAPSLRAANVLLAAAAAAADDETLGEAKAYLASHPAPEGEISASVWIEVLAAEALIVAGDLDRAAGAIAQLGRDPRASQAKVRNLAGRLKSARKARQGRLL